MLSRSADGADGVRCLGLDGGATKTALLLTDARGAAFVCGAPEAAKERGCFTAALTSSAGTPVTRIADVSVVTDTGAEVITGSTRMKAGAAHVRDRVRTDVLRRGNGAETAGRKRMVDSRGGGQPEERKFIKRNLHSRAECGILYPDPE